jgi:hypothetical protein
MGTEEDRAFHLERAAQCRRMAEEAIDPAVRGLHEQLARFHEAEAKRHPTDMTTSENHA